MFRVIQFDRASNVNRDFLHRRPWLPLVWLFNAGWTTSLFVMHAILHATCRFRLVGTEHLAGRENFIFAAWHVHAVPYCVCFWKVRRQMVLIGNDDWFMTPIHLFLRGKGVRRLLSMNAPNVVGETVALLKQGHSTVIYPDGPGGPARRMKRGLMALAMQSGLPVLPMHAETTAAWVWRRSWDGKRIPLPFSTVTLTFHAPVTVTPEGSKEAQRRILAALG